MVVSIIDSKEDSQLQKFSLEIEIISISTSIIEFTRKIKDKGPKGFLEKTWTGT